MKILLINKLYYPDIGGVETVVRQYAEYMVNNGWDVSVLCCNKKRSIKTSIENQNGVNVYRSSSFGMLFSMPISLSFIYWFYRLCGNYDILHFHEPYPMASILFRFLRNKKKIIVTWHSDIVKQKRVKKYIEYFQKSMCKNADVITTTSRNLLINSSVISLFEEKVKVIPLSINIDQYSLHGDILFDDLSKEQYILYLGRMSYYKGVEILLSAYEKCMTKVKLVVAGDGDAEIVRGVNDAVKNTKKSILFINRYISDDEKKNLLKNCLFFVFPSVMPSEAFGILQLEAMIYSKAVINTALPTGVPYVSVDGLTGITVKPFNIDQLAQAIDDLCFDKKRRDKYAFNAFVRVRDIFNDEIVLRQIKNVYEMVYDIPKN